MNKYAAYCITRNYYGRVIPSLKSLLANSDVDKVFLLIEDDGIGFELPKKVQCINVSAQPWFSRSGPNYGSHWTYMVMMRVVLCYVLPDVDKILSLDCDTIIMDDISDLWDTDLGDNYFAGVKEPHQSLYGYTYVNCGVLLWNLKQMRDGKVDQCIDDLNRHYHLYAEQDCLNAMCQGRVLLLPSWYNATQFSEPTDHPLIKHFAAEPGWWDYDIVKEWKERPWDET